MSTARRSTTVQRLKVLVQEGRGPSTIQRTLCWRRLATLHHRHEGLYIEAVSTPDLRINGAVSRAARLKAGDNLILAAFGGGFTWGAIYLKWAYTAEA